MATRRETADFILHRLGGSDRFTVRSMFGEFALYADGKPVAFICEDHLFVKILPESAELEGRCERAPAYPGSKDYYLVPEDMVAGYRELPRLLLRIGIALPPPKAKKKRG
jgi:TfoX/Sxy family transcriptional regulator of competence genes